MNPHHAVQQRTLGVLFVSAMFGRAASTLGFTVAALLVSDMLGASTWAGLSTVAITVGAAFGATGLSKVMGRRGRRPGLVLGYGVGVLGALVALLGAQNEMLEVFLVGLGLTGVGSGASNLGRYAAADLATPDTKAKAISFIVFASTAGAVGGPTLVEAADRLGRDLGLGPRVGPLAGTALLLLVAGAVVWAALRPDPLALSHGLQAPKFNPRDPEASERVPTASARGPAFSPRGPSAGLRGPSGGRLAGGEVDGRRAGLPIAGPTKTERGTLATLGVIKAGRASWLALCALAISQSVMIAIMAMTPLHMDHHGHSLGVIGWVISVHTAGMYAFAPIVGWGADRYGTVRTIGVGAATLAAASVLTALAGDASSGLMFPGLYLLGFGWCACNVAASALLTQSVPDEARVAAQGVADLCANLSSGGAALLSGLVLAGAGFGALSMLGLAGSLALCAAVLAHRRGPRSQGRVIIGQTTGAGLDRQPSA